MKTDFEELFPELNLEPLKSAARDLAKLYQPTRILVYRGSGVPSNFIILEYGYSRADFIEAFHSDRVFAERKIFTPNFAKALREWPEKRDWKDAWEFCVRGPESQLPSDVDEEAFFVLYREQTPEHEEERISPEDMPGPVAEESGYPPEVLKLVEEARPEILRLYEDMKTNAGSISLLFSEDNRGINPREALKEAALNSFDVPGNHFQILKREFVEDDILYASSRSPVKRDFIGGLLSKIIHDKYPYHRKYGVKGLDKLFRKKQP